MKLILLLVNLIAAPILPRVLACEVTDTTEIRATDESHTTQQKAGNAPCAPSGGADSRVQKPRGSGKPSPRIPTRHAFTFM